MENIKTEYHPFKAFIPPNARILILGSFPGKEQTQEISKDEDWFYGAKRNNFWKIISAALNKKVESKKEKQELFSDHLIAITDIFLEVKRKNNSNLDKNLIIVKDNKEELLSILMNNNFDRVLFTSKYVEEYFIKLFPNTKNYFCLPSPSGGANIPISKTEEFKFFKNQNPQKNTIDFRIDKYKYLLKL